MEWIELKCPRCGHVSNYKRTLSGTTPCSATRCRHLIRVGKMTADERTAHFAELDRINKKMEEREIIDIEFPE